MSTLSIQDMKERILKPTRSALNAKKSPPVTTLASETPSDGPRGQTDRTLEPGPLAYHPPAAQRPGVTASLPSFQALFGGSTPLRIPKPSELFGIQPGVHRAPTHATMQHLPPPSGVPEVLRLPPPGQLTAAGVTRQREHDRRLRALSKRMNRTKLQQRMAAHNPAVEITEWMPMPLDTNPPSPGWGGFLTGLRQWYHDRSSPSTPHTEQDMGVHVEFDTDVVDALVYTMGRWLGLDAEQLRDSPGLRTLVSRNIQWFRSSPDWLKLAGLVFAKKLNQSLDCPRRSLSDTQRMLLDRMLQSVPTKEGQTDGSVVAETAEEISMPIDPVPPATKPNTPPSKTKKGCIKISSKKTTAPKSKPTKSSAATRGRTKESSPKKRVRAHTTTPGPSSKRRPIKLRSLLTDHPSDVSVDTVPMDVESVVSSDLIGLSLPHLPSEPSE